MSEINLLCSSFQQKGKIVGYSVHLRVLQMNGPKVDGLVTNHKLPLTCSFSKKRAKVPPIGGVEACSRDINILEFAVPLIG